MTRIVAGTAKGRILKVPTAGTRPTSERVREALFSRLEHRGYIQECRVLDLYAGSGALGLEAASRGASYVELVEASSKAAHIIRANASELGLGVNVRACKVQTWLDETACEESFDLALLDPPYDMTEEELSLALLALEKHVCDDALIVVERSSRSPQPLWPHGWKMEDKRAFGDTCLWTATTGRLEP